MILLWGLPGDRPLAMVYNALQRLECSVVLLDQRDVLQTDVELSVGSSVEGILRIGERTINFSTVHAVYLRPYDPRRLPAIASAGQNSESWKHALTLEDALMAWVEVTPALVVNPPAAMAVNNSKLYQATWIQSFGFEIPDTLITTDPVAVREFWQRHGTVIYKSISGIRSIVSRLTDEHLDRIENVVWCPTQFQQYITGIDYRVHVVGEEVFSCMVVSQADDYRYASRGQCSVTIQACDLPPDVANRCKMLAMSMNLVVAGLDLRCTPDGKWYCFEVNPSPGFSYFQNATNQPIDEAIARLLASSDSGDTK